MRVHDNPLPIIVLATVGMFFLAAVPPVGMVLMIWAGFLLHRLMRRAAARRQRLLAIEEHKRFEARMKAARYFNG